MGGRQPCEEGVISGQSWRGEHLQLTEEQGLNLITGAANGRGRGDVLGPPNRTVAVRSCCERLDRRLIEADHAAERTLDEVEFVLQDEVRRCEASDGDVRARGRILPGALRQRRAPRGTPGTVVPEVLVVSIHVAEQPRCALLEREPSELVDGGDDDGWAALIDLFVDRVCGN